MTINSLSQTNSIQVRQLLENCGVTIKKEISGRFEVVCPQCQSSSSKYAPEVMNQALVKISFS